MAKSNFIVRGGADFSAIKKEMTKTQKQFKKFQFNLSDGLKTLGKLTGITLGAKALVDFGKASIKVASDLEEIQNVTDTVFKSMAMDIDEFSKNLIDSHGIGELTAKKYASYMGAMLKSSGITGDAVGQMSKDLTKLTADMASFYNLETDEMFQKLMSGMSGATMPLKKLGINMNIANLEAFALSQGIQKTWQEMTQAEQVMLRYQYLMAVTGDAQGDFARNSWNWAHSLKILGEKWQEFMSIVGKGLKAVFLPLVKLLIKVLDILIAIGRTVEKIYAMITGKKVDVEPKENMAGIVDINDNIGKSAGNAAKGQKDLAKGIDKAGKAAKGALMPFDELNILQDSLGSSGDGGSDGLGGLGELNNINTDFKIDNVGESIADGIQNIKNKMDDCYFPILNKWENIRQTLMIPIHVPAPVFAAIPDPIYKPNWGLDVPRIPLPEFPLIPSPIYNPQWGLDLPPIPTPIFPPIPEPVYEPVWNLIPPPVPAVDYSQYAHSLETMKIRTAEIFADIKERVTISVRELTTSVVTSYGKMKQGAIEHTEELRQGQSELWEDIKTATETVTDKISNGISTAWNTIETNFKTHKENVGTIATGIATILVTNINQGLFTLGRNTNTTIQTVQNNLQAFGRNVGTIAAGAAKSFANNLSQGYQTASQNFATFANTVGRNLKSFGSGFLRASAETARGFVNNMVSGFTTVWNNFKNLMSGIGEKVSGWFSANKSVITKTAIGAGIAVGAGALALAVPTAIPYAVGGLAGLASVPALAKGGITDGPMMALIGDNLGGREVVSPLDDLMGMIANAVGTEISKAMQIQDANSGDGDIILKIGETEFGRIAIKAINTEQRRVGKTLLIV